MVAGKKKNAGPRHLVTQSSVETFDDSAIHQIITTTPVEQVAGAMREAVFANYENVHLRCPDTGITYLHLIADNPEKFCDARALPAVYMLCYVGIDVSAQDNEEQETVLHRLVKKPDTRKLIIAVLRYGVHVSVKNIHGQTAEEWLEGEQPPWYHDTLHWYRKLEPGLCCFITQDHDNKLSLEQVETLLKGWCKINIYWKGKPHNILQDSQMRAKDALLAELLKKYYWTNEFVNATLAGLPDEMRRIYKEGKKRVDVDTMDHCYQLNSDCPVVPQPLVAAAWEQSNYEVIDQLLLCDADVCTSYSNQPETNPAKPLFYQTLLGTPRVNDVNIMLRILQEGDLRCKTERCTTFLHESVNFNLPARFVAKIVCLDAPLEERDDSALTARELALKRNKLDIVQVLDNAVIEAAKEGDVKRLENLVLQMYDIYEVKTPSGKTLPMLADTKELPSKVIKFIHSIPEIRSQMLNLWNCVYRNDLVQLKKYFNNKDMKRVVYSRNRAGRSILLTAIMNKNKEAIRMILKKHPKLVEYFDNHMLTSLHYAYLVFEDVDKEPAQMLQAAGASVDWCCTLGMSAYFYQKGIMAEEMFAFVQNFVRGIPFKILPDNEQYKQAFTLACTSGNMAEVRRLVNHFHPYGPISVLSDVLFDVIDSRQEEMALYLLDEGCDSSITKQYEVCSPDTSEYCAMMECFHPRSSLLQRAKINQLHRLSYRLSSTEVNQNGGHEVMELQCVASQLGPTEMEVDPETGMNINGSNNNASDTDEDGSMGEAAADCTESTQL